MHPAAPHKNPVAKALHKLSDLASDENVRLELALCHGAVIAVASTTGPDQGCVVRPNDIVIRLAETVYLDQRLRHDWLETEVAIFIADAAAAHTLRPEEFTPGVVLSVNETARILALKLHLLGAPLTPDCTDARDAAFLLGKINVSSPEQIVRIYSRVFPGQRFSDTAHHLVDRAFRARLVTGH